MANMLKSQAPIDSFGSIDFAVALIVIFSILVVVALVGFVIGVLKYKGQNRRDLNKEN